VRIRQIENNTLKLETPPEAPGSERLRLELPESPGEMERQQTLLVNYWYANAVGHAIEGLRYSLGYKQADPSMRVSLLLNGATPVELARCAPFVETFYLVPFTHFTGEEGDPRAALAGVPREWDWVVDNHRSTDPGHDRISGFRRFYDASHAHFALRAGSGVAGASPPAYEPHHQLRLELPDEARTAAAAKLNGRQAISVVLAGHSDRRVFYPSASSWELILRELGRRFPDALFCLIGKLDRPGIWDAARSRVGRRARAYWGSKSTARSRDPRSTSSIGRDEVDRIAAACPSIGCFDLPLLEQLAIVEASVLYVSPHTGFGFAAVAVGTPWLTISGGHWHEYFFNGVPFHSVIPDTDRYPCFAQGGPLPRIESDEDGEGPRTPSMCVARVREDLPELLDAAELLIEGRMPYERALAEYFPRLVAAYKNDRSRIFSFDNIHRSYL
jgi:hypothetical protein